MKPRHDVQDRPRASRCRECANLAIALYTPPVGGTLFVAAKLAKAGIGAITRHLAPLMAATVAVLLFVTYVPSLTLGVARFLVK